MSEVRLSIPGNDWYPQNYYIQPHYRTIPEIRVADCFSDFFELAEQRLFWRSARDWALGDWSLGTGLTLKVRWSNEPYKCQRITLIPGDVPDPIPGWAAFEEPACDEDCRGCAWAQLDYSMVNSLVLARNKRYLRYLIGHEIGHCLGFGHGGTGIMGGGWGSRVNDEEIAAARAYWFPSA